MMTISNGQSPPVVFIAQLGTGGDSWQPVIGLLTCSATTCTYDRPGTGTAPPRPAPNPPLPYSAFADELAALLADHDVVEPVVVVGHSVGDLIVRVFASRYPDRVAGVVHIDGSIPRLNLWPAVMIPQSPDGDGPDATHFDILAGEIEILDGQPLRVPSAVISRTPGRWASEWLPTKSDPLWTAYQRQLARLWDAPRIIATDAGHQIPDEAPRLVAHVIDRVVQAARTKQPFSFDEVTLGDVGGVVEHQPGDR